MPVPRMNNFFNIAGSKVLVFTFLEQSKRLRDFPATPPVKYPTEALNIHNTANSSNIIEVLEKNKVEFWSRKVKGNIFISGPFHEIVKRNSSMFIGK